MFALSTLIVLLAFVAAIPIVNLIALGYLLDAEGRVGRNGPLRDAFPRLESVSRIGQTLFCIWMCVIPLRLLARAASDAQLIDPGSPADRRLQFVLSAAWIIVTIHICLALARGGTVSCFLRPWRNVRWFREQISLGDLMQTASARIETFVRELRLGHLFWIGLRGFAGAFAWLVLPTVLFGATGETDGPRVIVTLLGGALLAVVLSWLPFLQARFATEQRLAVMLQLRTVRRLFRNAPYAWLLAVTVTYVFALPLYLLKVALPPQDAYWLITILFVASIYPARIVTGWAYSRAVRRNIKGLQSNWVGRWLARLGVIPVVVGFVFLLYFTQFISAHGTGALFEHHAFLLPWPGSPP